MVNHELLVYDTTCHVASRLDRIAAAVLQRCDGTRTPSELARLLTEELDQTVDVDMVLNALDCLLEAGLIDAGYEQRPDAEAALSRRRFLRRSGAAAAGALAAPAVLSMAIPSAAAAASGPIAPHPPAPSAETGEATGIEATSALFTGTLDGSGQPTTYFFQYGLKSSLAKHHSSTPPHQETGARPANVSAVATGLKPDTIYYFRLVAQSDGGTAYGADKVFRTVPKPVRRGS